MRMINAIVNRLDALIFGPTRTDPLNRALSLLALACLYVLGAALWVRLFNRGEIALSAFDWRQQRIYYAIMRDALQTGQIPFFMTAELQTTNRFLGIPETSLLPHVLLLPFVSQQHFALLETLLFYSVGFVGCLLIKRRFRLSLLPFTFVFLLFTFNGYITSHIAIGHVMWHAYFLLPLFILPVFDLIAPDAPRHTALKLALVLFVIVLHGAVHIYTWCALFLLVLALANLRDVRLVKRVLTAILLSGLLSTFRLIPAALTFWGEERFFVSGYATLSDLFGALTEIRDFDYVSQFNPNTASVLYGAGWWEFDAFVGLAGLAAILYFGVALRFTGTPELSDLKYTRLDTPLLTLFIFSLNDFYKPIRSLPIPLVQSQRVPTRFLILPLLFLLVIAAARLEKLLPRLKDKTGAKLLSIAAVVHVGLALRSHLLVWQIPFIESIFPQPEPITATVLSFSLATLNASDRLYVLSVIASAVVSLLALLAVIALYARRGRQNTPG